LVYSFEEAVDDRSFPVLGCRKVDGWRRGDDTEFSRAHNGAMHGCCFQKFLGWYAPAMQTSSAQKVSLN
jgi:hypothetical protein